MTTSSSPSDAPEPTAPIPGDVPTTPPPPTSPAEPEVPPPADAAPGPTRLTFTVKANDGDPGQSWTLSCDPAGGDHPDPTGACARLAQAATDGTDLFAPKRADEQCLMQYYGPETAVVKGTWNGTRVAATFSRRDSCEERRWRRMAAVLPTPPGIGTSPG